MKNEIVNPTDVEQQNIETADRRMQAATRRRDETKREITRATEDAELFGRSVDLEQLQDSLASDQDLVERMELDLVTAKNAPAIRSIREKRGAELKRDMRTLDARIEAAMESISPLMVEAVALHDATVKEFSNPKYPAFCLLLPPFADADAKILMERLRFWAKETGDRGAITLFSDRLKRYRALKEPKPAVVAPQSKPLTRQRS